MREHWPLSWHTMFCIWEWWSTTFKSTPYLLVTFTGISCLDKLIREKVHAPWQCMSSSMHMESACTRGGGLVPMSWMVLMCLMGLYSEDFSPMSGKLWWLEQQCMNGSKVWVLLAFASSLDCHTDFAAVNMVSCSRKAVWRLQCEKHDFLNC